ncbi:MAG: M15 family metallopeptidase [Pseudomonadota bacterium]|nr:M15 family metallopeptidase [Pseudomonadota bacterium]
MVFIALIFYFLVACCGVWLVLFPAGREAAFRVAGNVASQFSARHRRLRLAQAQLGKRAVNVSGHTVRRAFDGLRRHYLLCLAGLALILLPPIVALTLSGKSMLQGFDDNARDTNLQVAELLKGEQLVPPPPLPPDFFTTQEVQQIRPMLVTASRNWQLLNSDYAQRLLLVFKIMKETYGYDMAILEGYRSPERQNMLAAMGEHVTNAAAFQSYHQYGLAADCAFVRNGKLVISEKDPWAMEGYRRYGEVAMSVGLTWGGNWKMMDFGHTELRIPGVIKK